MERRDLICIEISNSHMSFSSNYNSRVDQEMHNDDKFDIRLKNQHENQPQKDPQMQRLVRF